MKGKTEGLVPRPPCTKILSTGTYLPRKKVSNWDLIKAHKIDSSHEWIVDRTGIHHRHISDPEGGEWPTDMAYHASKMALDEAGLLPNDIDLIIFSTSTADVKLPNCASILQSKLGIKNFCGCFDLYAACSGFVYAFNVAHAMIQSGANRNILVVGSESLSREIDWQDRNICVIFGDGAGAMILASSELNHGSEVLATHLATDGSGREFFDQPVGGTATPATAQLIRDKQQFMRMRGREMFKVATRSMAENAQAVCQKANISIKDVDWLIPHQANARIIEKVGHLLGIDPEKVIINIHRCANTSAASVPLAFKEALGLGKIKRGDLVLFDAFGAGVTSGATLLRY